MQQLNGADCRPQLLLLLLCSVERAVCRSFLRETKVIGFRGKYGCKLVLAIAAIPARLPVK